MILLELLSVSQGQFSERLSEARSERKYAFYDLIEHGLRVLHQIAAKLLRKILR